MTTGEKSQARNVRTSWSSLKDSLVGAILTATCRKMPGNCPCVGAGCETCQILIDVVEFTGNKTGHKRLFCC